MLITCTLPKKKNVSSNTHQIEHVPCLHMICLIWKKGRIREVRIKPPFYTMQRINPFRFHSEYNKHALLHIQTDFTVWV
ncbi:unnamed protein product [Staurois parvus]|uniref:Uncharacterized protein n=1 Tax=Staurois parvus TaxID=386267 RepID=A0ABN9EZ94_9NEOB|nr:unnamed protein product [Staurois parvus]